MRNDRVSISPPHHRVAKIFSIICLGLALVAHSSAPATADAGVNWVTSVGNRVLAVVGNPTLSNAQKAGRFSSILSGKADIRRMGKFALGKYARSLKGGQSGEYYSLVKRFVMNVYFTRLNEFAKGKGGKVVVLGSQSRNRDVIVSSNIKFATGRTISVKWRLVKSGGGLKLFDLNVAGVWLVVEQRSQFVSIISRNSGKIEALLTHLRRSS